MAYIKCDDCRSIHRDEVVSGLHREYPEVPVAEALGILLTEFDKDDLVRLFVLMSQANQVTARGAWGFLNGLSFVHEVGETEA